MAKQQQAMITAQHVSRTDKDGNPQVKQFTRKAWDNIPMRHYSSREVGIVKQTKNGCRSEKRQAKKHLPH